MSTGKVYFVRQGRACVPGLLFLKANKELKRFVIHLMNKGLTSIKNKIESHKSIKNKLHERGYPNKWSINIQKVFSLTGYQGVAK